MARVKLSCISLEYSGWEAARSSGAENIIYSSIESMIEFRLNENVEWSFADCGFGLRGSLSEDKLYHLDSFILSTSYSLFR